MAGCELREPNFVTGHFHVRGRPHGFTMVELIVVMILAGILGAIGVSRYFDRTGFDADGFTAQARTMLRYAQKVAVAQNRPVFVRLDGGGIALFVCYQAGMGCTSAMLPAPSGANSGTSATRTYCGSSSTMCEAVPAGISYTTSPATAYFYFDAQGKPYAPADTSGVLASSFAPLALNISAGGVIRTVKVTPETGYVY
jgi:MSHA pilin protein MshC